MKKNLIFVLSLFVSFYGFCGRVSAAPNPIEGLETAQRLGHNMSSAMTSILANVVAPVLALLSVCFVLWGIGFITRLLKESVQRSKDLDMDRKRREWFPDDYK
ncbi:MAG: hypothetical protein WCP12_16100 [bacterium]